MTKAIYPGTFDPITNGHLDVIFRSSKLFDQVDVVVSYNRDKNHLFTVDERIKLISDCVSDWKNVSVSKFKGLTVDYLKKVNAQVIIRGLRAVSDFEFEFQLALMNKKLDEKCETIYMMPGEKYTYLNSSIVKEIAELGGNVNEFVTENVASALIDKLPNMK